MKIITRVIITIVIAMLMGLFLYVYTQPEKEYNGTFVRGETEWISI